MDNENEKINGVPETESAAPDAAVEAPHRHDAPQSPYYGGEKSKTQQKRSGAASIFDIAEMFAICAAVVLVIFTFVARLTVVEGPSMETTLHENEFILVRSLCYEPKKGDIVVVNDPTAGVYSHPLIKRVIAVGGDTVDIDFSTWTLTVNGEVVDESKYRNLDVSASTITSDFTFPMTIKEGHIFVMGDNRNHSADSRAASIGQIDERCVVGKAAVRLFPINRFTVFENPYEE